MSTFFVDPDMQFWEQNNYTVSVVGASLVSGATAAFGGRQRGWREGETGFASE